MRRKRSGTPDWTLEMVKVCNQCAFDPATRARVLQMTFEEGVKFFAFPVDAVEQLIANEDANPRTDAPREWHNNILPALRALCEFSRKFNAIIDRP